MNKGLKRALKIFLWTLGSIFLLLVLIILLLSVLFPSKYVKGIIEENLRAQLKREVVLNDFDFSILKGISIGGLDIKERKLFGGQTSFVRIKSLNVDYSILPLIFKQTFVLNEATVKGAEIYVIAKQINGKTRYNFDDLFQIPDSNGEKKEAEVLDDKEAMPPQMKKPAMPLAFSLGKVGIEDCKLDFKDYTSPIVTMEYTVDKITALITNMTSALNPFGMKGGLQISLHEIKKDEKPVKSFNLFVGLEGKIKPFDQTGFLNPEVNMDLKVQNFYLKGGFLQTAINNGLKLAINDMINKINNNLPQYTEEIKKKLMPEVDKQLANLDAKINQFKQEQGLGKEELKKEKESQLKDFDQTADSTLNDAIKPALSEADKLPSAVRDAAKKEILKNKESIKTKTRESLSKQLDKIIESYDKEVQKQIENMKKTAKGQVDKTLTAVIKASADQLRSWGKSLADKGLGLGFLNGAMSFDGGKIPFALKNWEMLLQNMDLMSKDFGIQGDISYGLFTSRGETKTDIFLPESFDILGIFKPFVKNNLIQIPLYLSFDNKKKEYQLNKSPLSNDQIKDFAVNYAMNYAKGKVGLGGPDSSSSQGSDKYKKTMTEAKKGNLKSASDSGLKSGEIVDKYKKSGEKVEDAGKKIKSVKKKLF